MTKTIGTILRVISVFWIASALFRILMGLAGSGRENVVGLGFVALLIGVATFKFGTWLKNRQALPPIAQQISKAKSAWWGSEYGFRLSVFLGVSWAISAFLWQDNSERNLNFVFWPPIGLVTAYFAYRKFVIGRPATEAQTSHAIGADIAKSTGDLASHQLLGAVHANDSLSSQSAEDRERAMNELISKMK